MSDELLLNIEIHDESVESAGRDERRVSIELRLPTGEGSEGPDLEGDEWEHALSTLIRWTVDAARSAIDEPNPTVTEELTHLDRVVDAAHKRLDAIGAPDAPPFNIRAGLRRAGEQVAAAMREANRGTVDDASR